MEQKFSSFRVMAAANHSKNSAMEAQNHVKHGRCNKKALLFKKYLALLSFVFISSLVLAQTNLQDVVYLKNGSVVRGVIIEQVPNQSIRLQTTDGNIFAFQMDDIERLTREQRLGNNQSVKSPGLAWCLSFLMPGVGQFYNGDPGKGAIFLSSYLVGWGLHSIGLAGGPEPFIVLGLIISGTSWIWSQIDAPVSASKKNKAANSFAWNLGNGDAILSLQPDFNFMPISTGQKVTPTPTYGVGINIQF